MTPNKPEVVVAYRYTASRSFGNRNRKWHYQESFPHAANREVAEIGQMEELVRLSDYEALQAELAREPQRRFDGNEQSSREHREEIAVLVEALEALLEVQEEDCRYDHEGYCQSHNLDHVDDGCRVARAKTALAAHRKQKENK